MSNDNCRSCPKPTRYAASRWDEIGSAFARTVHWVAHKSTLHFPIIDIEQKEKSFPEKMTVAYVTSLPLPQLLCKVTPFFGGAIVAGSNEVSLSPVDAARARPNFECELLNALGEAVIATDINGCIVFWNLAAERLYGWRAIDVEGRNILDVTPCPQSRAQAVEIFESLTRGNSWSGVFETKHKDGRRFLVSVSNYPVRGPNGELTAIVGVSRVEVEQVPFVTFPLEDQFDPEFVKVLLEVFTSVCQALGVSDPADTLSNSIARTVITMAHEGERDAGELYKRTVDKFSPKNRKN